MREFDRTYVEVDLKAIRYNITEARKVIRPDTALMAIVKADGYGHGAIPVASAVDDLVDAYGVAMIEEALSLRQSGIDKPILILGYTGEDWFEELVRQDISQTVYNWEMAWTLNRAAAKAGGKARVHIKVDTGMGRLGFPPTQESAAVVQKIHQLPNIEVEGLFTHFARADEETIEPAREPFRKYLSFREMLRQRGVCPSICHVSNSAAVMAFPEANLDMVRFGISLYGLYPSRQMTGKLPVLKPAMQWKARISYVKTVEPGAEISYGGTFRAVRPTIVATVPVGYADGMKRCLSGCGRVLVRGQYAPILGRICMDQFMIDVADIPEVEEGDYVTIFGRDGDRMIPVEEVADLAHSFNYEFVCSITSRVPRKYIYPDE